MKTRIQQEQTEITPISLSPHGTPRGRLGTPLGTARTPTTTNVYGPWDGGTAVYPHEP
ncbi:hypothetical protein SBV1_410104 [Verrucomicrobia bacterium]|nr:hypothetical protein SBV1_410104 [Verrucomicrobiota bacterium]